MKLLISILAALLLTSCVHQTSSTTTHNKSVDDKSKLASYYEANPGLEKLADDAVAYVIYPYVSKAAIGAGAAHGQGDVYEKGMFGYKLVGHSELTQINAGLQLGGQSYSEIVFFKNKKAFKKFKRGKIEFSANASVVALEKGKALKAKYNKGCAVVILDQKGLMGELSLGGQKLSFKSL